MTTSLLPLMWPRCYVYNMLPARGNASAPVFSVEKRAREQCVHSEHLSSIPAWTAIETSGDCHLPSLMLSLR